MNLVRQPPGIVRWTKRLEDATVLDVPVRAVEPTVQSVFGTGNRASVLRGEWLGHAVHPVLTDVVLGTWTSASLLDLLGGRDASGGGPEAPRRGTARRCPDLLDRLGRVDDGRPA